jgi:aspartate/methionine/tyrosine aminotransferase
MFYGIQKGAIAALVSGREWFKQLDAVYTRRRSLVFELADKLGCRYDEKAVGMFVWAKLPAEAPDSETYVDQLLYGKDLFIAPGTIFGSRGEGYVRFSLCVKEELITEASRRIKI